VETGLNKRSRDKCSRWKHYNFRDKESWTESTHRREGNKHKVDCSLFLWSNTQGPSNPHESSL